MERFQYKDIIYHMEKQEEKLSQMADSLKGISLLLGEIMLQLKKKDEPLLLG